MAGTLPAVRSGAVALYPIVRQSERKTGLIQFMDGSEQRWKQAAPLARFELAYSNINATDRSGIDAFVASQKGAFDSTWSFALSTTYQDLAFEDDSITWTEGPQLPGRYSGSIRFRQTITGNAAAAGSGTSYPTINGGVTTQYPFVSTQRYKTEKNTAVTGKQYAYAFFGGGLSGFPTRGLWAWTLNYPVITDSEVATLEAFFALQGGRVGSFSFTDPKNAAVYTKVRFDQDVFEVRAISPNVNSVVVKLAEFN